MNEITPPPARIVYLDVLRILACFLVVTTHVSALQLDALPVRSLDYFITNTYNISSFIGVTLFAMISGALLLGAHDTHLREPICIKKSVLGTVRFFTLYYLWKAIYQVIDLLNSRTPLTPSAIKNDVLLALIKERGYYHLWYLPMIALIYLAVPVIGKAMGERRVCEYFLCIFFVAGLLFPTLFHYKFRFKYLFVDFFQANDFSFFGGYLGYFILGHYLNCFCSGADSTKRRALYALGTAGFVFACLLGFYDSLAKGTAVYTMNTPFTPMMFAAVSAVFMACKQLGMRLSLCPDALHRLHLFSQLTLGIYLLHPAVLLATEKSGFVPASGFVLFSIPPISFCIMVLCGAASLVLLKIPGFRRLIF